MSASASGPRADFPRQLATSQEVIRDRALHDPLTGLNNRMEFQEHLREAFLKSGHLNHPAAVITVDLDRFKAVNDTGGHAASDAILRQVADACRGVVRGSGTVARLGGDEFAVILENCGAANADQIAPTPPGLESPGHRMG
jgi:diguanylate cyclase (GGDEF)-like protein